VMRTAASELVADAVVFANAARAVSVWARSAASRPANAATASRPA
jgi:hypothetical protein